MIRIILFFSFHRERQNFVSENYINRTFYTPKNMRLLLHLTILYRKKRNQNKIYIIGYRIVYIIFNIINIKYNIFLRREFYNLLYIYIYNYILFSIDKFSYIKTQRSTKNISFHIQRLYSTN